MADFPALPLWTDAYLADTMHMSCLESGAYLHLLMAAWRTPGCTLPDDDKMLGRMARCTPREWAKIRSVVMNFWTHDEKTKTWSQKRLLKEREYVRETSDRRKHAAETRWLKNNKTQDAHASPEHMQEPCKPDAPIPTSLSKDKGADAPRSDSDPWKQIYAGLKKHLGTKAGGLISRLRQVSSERELLSWLQMLESGEIADGHEYLGRILATRERGRAPPAKKRAPVVGTPEWHEMNRRMGID